MLSTFFLSFLLSLTAVRSLIVGVKGYCCSWPYQWHVHIL